MILVHLDFLKSELALYCYTAIKYVTLAAVSTMNLVFYHQIIQRLKYSVLYCCENNILDV